MNNPNPRQRTYDINDTSSTNHEKSSEKSLAEELNLHITVYKKESLRTKIAQFFKRIWHKFF